MQLLKQRVSLSLLAVVLLSGLLAVNCDRRSQTQPPRPDPEVSIMTVQTQKVMLTTELPGRTSACRMAEIRPQVSGLILKRLFTEGADVKAGQMLYQIDPAPFQAALDNVKASLLAARKAANQARATLTASSADVARLQVTLELAQTNRDRYEASFKEKVVSTIRRDQAVTEAKVAGSALRAAQAQVEVSRQRVAVSEAMIQQAQAALKTARINLEYTRISAPICGRIGRSNVTEGAVVTAYQPIALATIQQLDPIFVDVPQSTTELLRLKRRLKDGRLIQNASEQNNVKLLLGDDTAYPQQGRLQFSDVTVDPTTDSVILRAVFPNPDSVLLPGMFVRAVVKEGLNEEAILIPQQGVSRDPKGNPYALLVDPESKAAFRALTLDRAIGNKWLVSDGLSPGDRLIVEGLLMLRPGTPVKAVPFDPTKTGHGPAADPDAQPQPRKDGGA